MQGRGRAPGPEPGTRHAGWSAITSILREVVFVDEAITLLVHTLDEVHCMVDDGRLCEMKPNGKRETGALASKFHRVTCLVRFHLTGVFESPSGEYRGGDQRRPLRLDLLEENSFIKLKNDERIVQPACRFDAVGRTSTPASRTLKQTIPTPYPYPK